MIKKSFIFLLTTLLVSCNMSKSVIQTSKNNSTSSVYKKREKTKKITSNNQKVETLKAISRSKVTQEMVLKYINNYKTVAQSNMKKYGIPASVILGQALLESGSGTGSLCAQANNHFGIKCSNDWSGESVRYDDDAQDECFRKYNNPNDSFSDHSLFLTGKKRYAALFNLDKTDYKAWARGLKEAGYATDEQYPSKLITLIEKYQLYQYDTELGNSFKNKDVNLNKNRLEYNQHIVEKGDTLYSISKKYTISIDDLKKKNSLKDDAIAIGQTILIIK
jgi:flagellum-specific peptidoglycan hydrolase FlgJ